MSEREVQALEAIGRALSEVGKVLSEVVGPFAAREARMARREEERVELAFDPSCNQCAGTLVTTGERCVEDAIKDGLCKRHWRLKNSRRAKSAW